MNTYSPIKPLIAEATQFYNRPAVILTLVCLNVLVESVHVSIISKSGVKILTSNLLVKPVILGFFTFSIRISKNCPYPIGTLLGNISLIITEFDC